MLLIDKNYLLNTRYYDCLTFVRMINQTLTMFINAGITTYHDIINENFIALTRREIHRLIVFLTNFENYTTIKPETMNYVYDHDELPTNIVIRDVVEVVKILYNTPDWNNRLNELLEEYEIDCDEGEYLEKAEWLKEVNDNAKLIYMNFTNERYRTGRIVNTDYVTIRKIEDFHVVIVEVDE